MLDNYEFHINKMRRKLCYNKCYNIIINIFYYYILL